MLVKTDSYIIFGGVCMSRGFIAGDRNQLLLLPPSVDKWVPVNHMVRFIWDIVKQMNLAAFYLSYGIEGRPPYDPAMMLAVLVYAYCQGRRSSRKIAKACEEELPYRWLTGNTVPDHCAIARFRARHEGLMKEVFCEILSLCAEAGLVRVGDVYLDGTKIKGSASLAANRTLDQLNKEIERMLEEARTEDEEEDRHLGPHRRGDELPEGMEDPGSRLARLEEAKARLEAKAEAEREEQAKKLRDREEEEKASGRKKPGPKPKDPEDAVRGDRKANATDPDSRIMKTRQGHVQGYNGQAVVSKDQIILGAEVTQEENDLHQLEPMIHETRQSLDGAGIDKGIDTCTADTGYWRDDLPVESIEANGPELLIAVQKDSKQRQQCLDEEHSCGRTPANASSRERMGRKLRTKRGKAKYKLRSQTVEPVFGQIKAAMGIHGFLRRGIDAVRSEWKLICACHNLMKLFRAFGVVPTS
jgi:transposase